VQIGDKKNKREETWREHGREQGEGGGRVKLAGRTESKSSWHWAFKAFSAASVVWTSLRTASKELLVDEPGIGGRSVLGPCSKVARSPLAT